MYNQHVDLIWNYNKNVIKPIILAHAHFDFVCLRFGTVIFILIFQESVLHFRE